MSNGALADAPAAAGLHLPADLDSAGATDSPRLGDMEALRWSTSNSQFGDEDCIDWQAWL